MGTTSRCVAPAVALAVLASLLVALQPDRARAAQSTTPNDSIQFFNVSLKLVKCTQQGNCDGKWRRAFFRMKRYHYRPDIINVLEAPWNKRDAVMKQVNDSFGGTWSSVHVDANQQCSTAALFDCGNTMLVYRSAKLTKKNGAGEDQISRFRHYQDGGDADLRCSDSELSTKKITLAAKLREKSSGRQVVVAGVHFTAGDGKQCVAKNLRHTNSLLEDAWPNRPLTIFAGDFNERPDVTSSTLAAQRREEKRSCWYKKWSGRFDAHVRARSLTTSTTTVSSRRTTEARARSARSGRSTT